VPSTIDNPGVIADAAGQAFDCKKSGKALSSLSSYLPLIGNPSGNRHRNICVEFYHFELHFWY
jgi:hypothetical protein